MGCSDHLVKAANDLGVVSFGANAARTVLAHHSLQDEIGVGVLFVEEETIVDAVRRLGYDWHNIMHMIASLVTEDVHWALKGTPPARPGRLRP